MARKEKISKAIQSLRDHCRVDQKAYSTEKAYVYWSGHYMNFLFDNVASLHGLTSEKKFEVWLTQLVTKGQVTASTQSQAFYAILCLYEHVWKRKLEGVNALRARRRKVGRHAPTVEEISKAFACVEDTSGYPVTLILHLLYGAGLRLGEGIGLRIKDIHFSDNKLIIHDSKHGKDRVVAIPEPLFEPLQRQVEVATMKARIDIANRLPVETPGAIGRKYKNAPYSLSWHFVFPKLNSCSHPRTGETVRFHILPTTIQRALKKAVSKAGLMTPFTPHNLRHAYATHMLKRTGNAKGIQEAMGHTDIRTTFGYIHDDALSVGSPLEAPKDIIQMNSVITPYGKEASA